MRERNNSPSNRIGEVEVTPIKPTGGLVGFASLVFEGCFYLGGIGVYTRPHGGYRLVYPTRPSANGGLNIFYPINKSIADEIETAVIKRFEEIVK